MMKLACKDINADADCAFEATGDSVEEVAGKMMAHAKAEHAEEVKGMSDVDMMKKFEAKAHS